MKCMTPTQRSCPPCRFGSLMDIDRLILTGKNSLLELRFGSLMDIDRLIHNFLSALITSGFGSLMDIDRLIRYIYIRKC